jgi:spoIIIJ-associated protein
MPLSSTPEPKLNVGAVQTALHRCVETMIRLGHFDLTFHIALPDVNPAEVDAPEILVEFDGADREMLLEHGAELLKALEYVAVRWLRLDPRLHDRVRFDCGNYRADRLAELKLSAFVAADRVRETHLPFRFNAMTARERRIVHLVLQNQQGIRTASEGTGDDRHLVVFPFNPAK